MQKFIRYLIVLLMIMVMAAIILSQGQLYKQHRPMFVAGEVSVAMQQSGEVVSPDKEREKDRDILQAIERDAAKIAASALAQNFVLLFQAIIYFLILVIIYSLLETVKKFADAAVKSAEAARISAEAAIKAGQQEPKVKVNKFIMRRACRTMRK